MQAVADLFPGYFALVMATGIISTATFLLGMKWLAWVLLVINLIAYAVLSFLLMIRVIGFYPRVKADLTDHTRGPGFLYRHRGNGCPRQPVPDRSGALPNGDGSVVLRAVTVGHFPLSYDPLYWRLVFPLGMYTVARCNYQTRWL
jgi:tellurite resistance protein TehA-like permease